MQTLKKLLKNPDIIEALAAKAATTSVDRFWATLLSCHDRHLG